MARRDLGDRRYTKAAQSAVRAEASIVDAIPSQYQARAQAIMIGGASRILRKQRTIGLIREAQREFVRAGKLFPPQTDIDSFDPILAQLMAWDSTTRSILRSETGWTDQQARREEKKWEPFPARMTVSGDQASCSGSWLKRKAPNYPLSAAYSGYVGAAIVGYHIDKDGKVTGERILAEVPTGVFGEYALKAMQDWQFELPVNPRPECKTNLIMHFRFRIGG